MLQLRMQVHATFPRLKQEHAAKNRAIPALAGSPKAKASGSNPLGCTITTQSSRST